MGGNQQVPDLFNQSFKRSLDSGLLSVQDMEGILCMAICVGEAPPRTPVPHLQGGTALPGGFWTSLQCCLCLGTHSAHPHPHPHPYSSSSSSSSIFILILPQTPCEWDRDAHWAWKRASIPHHPSALLLGKGGAAGDRWMERRSGGYSHSQCGSAPCPGHPLLCRDWRGVLGLLMVLEMVTFS